jgi:CRISPR-associated protein Csx10
LENVHTGDQVMKRIKLKIIAFSPLGIGAKKPGSISEAEDHIPGSAVRGAIASHILQLSNRQRPGIAQENLMENGGEFATLFLGNAPAVFQNAYPAVAKMRNPTSSKMISQVVEEDVLVLPATAVSSKTDSGFKPNAYGVFDTLIDRFCADGHNVPYDPSDPKSLQKKTDARVEPYGGFYSYKNGEYRSHSVSTRFLTRVGINRQRATSQDEILYSLEVLNESFLESPQGKNWQPVVYRSAILVEDATLAQSLTDFINENSTNFRLGGSTSRGLGKVQILAAMEDAVTDVEGRLTRFNQQLKERWQFWSSVFPPPTNNPLTDRYFFTLDLQADAVLNENWRRTTVISPAMLCEFVGLEDDNSLKLEVAYSSYNYRSGWNLSWGLMKDIELMTNRGAVYLFSTNQQDLWLEKLQELELTGVGDRTAEGFGQVQICNEFHSVFREHAK